MNQREYAQHRGISRQAVGQAIRAGRITAENGRIDPEQADREWAQRSRVRPHTGANGEPPANDPSVSDEDGDEIDYFAERARRERAEASLAEIKLAEAQGRMIDAEIVRKEIAAIAGTVREAMLLLPDRLAPLLEKRQSAFIQATLETEIRTALRGLPET